VLWVKTGTTAISHRASMLSVKPKTLCDEDGCMGDLQVVVDQVAKFFK
jgi:hypothetical protein